MTTEVRAQGVKLEQTFMAIFLREKNASPTYVSLQLNIIQCDPVTLLCFPARRDQMAFNVGIRKLLTYSALKEFLPKASGS